MSLDLGVELADGEGLTIVSDRTIELGPNAIADMRGEFGVPDDAVPTRAGLRNIAEITVVHGGRLGRDPLDLHVDGMALSMVMLDDDGHAWALPRPDPLFAAIGGSELDVHVDAAGLASFAITSDALAAVQAALDDPAIDGDRVATAASRMFDVGLLAGAVSFADERGFGPLPSVLAHVPAQSGDGMITLERIPVLVRVDAVANKRGVVTLQGAIADVSDPVHAELPADTEVGVAGTAMLAFDRKHHLPLGWMLDATVSGNGPGGPFATGWRSQTTIQPTVR
jgi:hypothetical protein